MSLAGFDQASSRLSRRASCAVPYCHCEPRTASGGDWRKNRHLATTGNDMSIACGAMWSAAACCRFRHGRLSTHIHKYGDVWKWDARHSRPTSLKSALSAQSYAIFPAYDRQTAREIKASSPHHACPKPPRRPLRPTSAKSAYFGGHCFLRYCIYEIIY